MSDTDEAATPESKRASTEAAVAVMLELHFIERHWPALCALRIPGTSRPWRQALLDPQARAIRAERDRAEREHRDPDAPGFTSAPEHLDVLDVLVDVWATLDELVAAISPDWRRSQFGAAMRRVTTIDVEIEFIRTWLYAAASSTPDIADRAARKLAAARIEINRVLSLITAGQMLTGAVCPWCRGVTPGHPAGGATTLRVEEIMPGVPASVPGATAREPVYAIVCWNPMCDPPEDRCGSRFRGFPAWPVHEWDWLEPQLIIAEPPASVIPPTVPADYEIVPIEHHYRGGHSTRPCTSCVYIEGHWLAAGHDPLPPCGQTNDDGEVICTSTHWCVHRAHPSTEATP